MGRKLATSLVWVTALCQDNSCVYIEFGGGDVGVEYTPLLSRPFLVSGIAVVISPMRLSPTGFANLVKGVS